MDAHAALYPVRRLCLTLAVHPSGYCAWKQLPVSERSHTSYGRRPGRYDGRPAVAAPNPLKRQFSPDAPKKGWVTSITHIRSHEEWLYLCAPLDLLSRHNVGWSMGERMTKELALNALLMAAWRRKPTEEVVVHSDQGSQFSSHDWQDFLRAHRLMPSVSRRRNCHHNAVAQSFFQLLKRERIKRKIYTERAQARSEVFDYIELFYNPPRRRGFTNQLSPVESSGSTF